MGDSYLDRIGDRFKELRKEKKLTLKELSEKTGLSIGYLSNLERNISSLHWNICSGSVRY